MKGTFVSSRQIEILDENFVSGTNACNTPLPVMRIVKPENLIPNYPSSLVPISYIDDASYSQVNPADIEGDILRALAACPTTSTQEL